MPECPYCGAALDDEDALIAHMGAEHEGELGTIDRRRVDDFEGDGGDRAVGPLVLGGVIVFALGMVIYVTVFLGGGGGGGTGTPGPLQSAHEHGTIEMRVLGEAVDFGRDRYQLQADRFHFEGGVGQVWHTHATGVRLAWAMDTLGIGVTEDSVTFQGTTYRDDDPNTEVTVEVNGESVDPETYVLSGTPRAGRADQGDHVRIVVRRTNGTAG